MDCNVDTKENLNSSHVVMPSDSHLASVRVGLHGEASMHKLSPLNSGREAFSREKMKELIREEILEKEKRRLLEEEVRRELEMERIMGLSRFQTEKLLGLAGTSSMAVHGDSLTHNFMSPTPFQARCSLSTGQGISQDVAEFVFSERSLSNQKSMSAKSQTAIWNTAEKPSPTNESNTTTCKLSGAKRDAQGEFLLPVEKQWYCALCQVSTTSEGALKEHLEGKRHRAKEGLLSSNKKTSPLQSNEIVNILSEGTSTSKSSKKKKKNQQVKHWCRICKVKCNSLVMLEHHLSGKRHKACLELKKANYSFKAQALKEERETSDI